jgi:hypothetical protein
MTAGMTAAISCSQCGSPFNFREGTRNSACHSCGTSLAVTGESGISRFYIEERLDLAMARTEARKFLATSGVDPKMVESLRFEGGELCYLPFWCLRALALGWLWLEREVVVREEDVDENGCKRIVERRGPNELSFDTVAAPLDFSSPAFDAASFGLLGIALAGAVLPLKAMDHETLSRRGKVFDPVKGVDQVRREALSASKGRFRTRGVLRCKDDLRICGEKLSLISYPVWRLSFAAGERLYPLVVDGINGKVLKGRFPGAIIFRLWQPMAAILLLAYAFSLHKIAGLIAVFAFLIWLQSARGLSPAGLATFFTSFVERKGDIEHG